MDLKNKITSALTDAMRNNDKDEKRVIRSILANLKNSEIDKQSPLEENEILNILHKEIKMRNETIEGALKINRQDIIDEAKNDIEIISRFLPAGLSEEELRAIIKATIDDIGATSIKDMGAVMKSVLPKVSGRASNSQISLLVKEYLQA